jgi:DNA repair ATPase RecN
VTVEATTLSNGAQWIRAALQVNPFEYEGRNAPSRFYDDEDSYNKDLLDECETLGISLIAITDHWCVDSSRGLVDAAKARGIVALPGFEANSSEGVHVLVIFDADTDFSTINASIGRCGGTPGCQNGTTGESYALIMERMAEAGALAIPAHVNVKPAGMLTTRSGQPLAAMIQAPELHVIGITPSVEATRDQQAIIDGTGIFERPHPLAIIHADDVMGPRQLRTAGASCWFKVSNPCLRSLKLAVRTPETRVSLVDPAVLPRPTLKRVSWVGGYLGDVDLPLSDDLTTLIGGRGAGKSTVIESIRYALGLEAISPQVQSDHRNIISDVLHTGTIVRVEVQAMTPTPQRFTIEREVPHPPAVLDSNGNRTSLQPSDVIGAVEIFGQHELAELAGSAERVADLVRRFNGETGDDTELLQTLRGLRGNREDLRRAEGVIVELEGELSRIEGLDEQVAHYESTDVPAKLAGQQRLTQDAAVFTEGLSRVKAFGRLHGEFTQSHELGDLGTPLDEIDGTPQAERLKRVRDATTTLRSQVDELNRQINDAITAAETEISAARQDWETATAEESSGYGEVLRELHESGLDPDKFVDTKAELSRLKAIQPRLTAKEQDLQKLHRGRAGLLAELRGHETRRTEQLHAAINAANTATGGVVITRPTAAKQRSHIMAAIKARTSGQRTQILAAVESDDFSPRLLAAAIRSGQESLGKLGIRGAQATGLVAAGEELARELEELQVEPAVEVLLQVDGGKLRSMNQLSKGQRATALLLLLLGASDAPLIIDQPEDDLDNNFVYKGVVVKLRDLKGKRQIIASTHNANVPVLGDAELIIALESDGSHGKPAPSGIGSLDDAPIRALAENILEGGPAAFNARQHLYGF